MILPRHLQYLLHIQKIHIIKVKKFLGADVISVTLVVKASVW